MKTIVVISSASYFKYDECKFSIGGAQTYVQDLLNLNEFFNCKTILCLINYEEEKPQMNWNNTTVFTFYEKKSKFRNANQKAFNRIFATFKYDDVKYVIISEQLSIKSKSPDVYAIQHGIAFDGECNKLGIPFLSRFYQHLRAWKNVNRSHLVPNLVGVDYNYFNWVRTLGSLNGIVNYNVILNHTSKCISYEELEQKLACPNEKTRIIFARRFVDYRGALIFARIINRLYNDGIDFSATFAGDGPLKQQLVDMFKEEPRVDFISFVPEKSVDIQRDYDISVVPTISSEGSSLSLAEAMGAGCLPVASHVGGMTNMIIDGFNGFLSFPSEDSFYKTLKKAILYSTDKKNEIIINAWKTASHSFSIDKWREQWAEVLSL